MSDTILNPAGDPALEESYHQRYLDSLIPCPICGRVDELDNAEGHPGMVCAACSLHDGDDPDDEAGQPEEWGP